MKKAFGGMVSAGLACIGLWLSLPLVRSEEIAPRLVEEGPPPGGLAKPHCWLRVQTPAETFALNPSSGERRKLAPGIPDGILSPDGKKRLRVDRSDGDGEIVLSNADGSGPKRLTDNAVEDDMPAWSPDGREIAFCSKREGNVWQVFLVDAEGKNLQQVTHEEKGAWAPRFHPKGWLGFLSERKKKVGLVWTGKEILTEVDEDGLLDFAWSPGGKQVLACFHGLVFSGSIGQSTLDHKHPVSMQFEPNDLHGRRERPLAGKIAWAPDGQWAAIAFTFKGDKGEETVLCLLDEKGQNLKQKLELPAPCRFDWTVDPGMGLK